MTEAIYQPPEGYVTMTQAQEILGVSKATMQKRVKAGLLPTYRDHRDVRVRLVKRADVERLTEPVLEGKVAA
jgi:excisionase family DNA binding protein